MIRAQFIRYAIVGLVLNAALYGAYLLVTSLGIGSKTAMTLTFSVGVLLSFIANRNVTFRHRGDQVGPLLRFIGCYLLIYLLNFAALWLIAGRMGVPHQIVQGGAILILALCAFTLQRYWVFPTLPTSAALSAVRTGR